MKIQRIKQTETRTQWLMDIDDIKYRRTLIQKLDGTSSTGWDLNQDQKEGENYIDKEELETIFLENFVPQVKRLEEYDISRFQEVWFIHKNTRPVTIENNRTFDVPVKYVVASGYIEDNHAFASTKPSIIWSSIEKRVEYENEYPNLFFDSRERAENFLSEFFIEDSAL